MSNSNRAVPNFPDNPCLRVVIGIACIVALTVAPIVEAFRGVDLTDTGFLVTGQKFIFDDPGAVAFWFHLWLTNVIGGLVNLVCGGASLFQMKLAAAPVFWGTVAGTLYLFRRSADPVAILLAIAVSMYHALANRINVIHYNNLSLLGFVWAVAFLVEGHVEQRPRKLFWAGFIIVLNAFVRIPNILGLFFILIVPILNLFVRERAKRIPCTWRMVGHFFAGSLAAAGIVWLAMVSLGHLDLYWSSLIQLFSSGEEHGSHYGMSDVIRRPFEDTRDALIYGTLGAAALVGMSWAVSFTRQTRLHYILAVVAAFAIDFYYFRHSPSRWDVWRLMVGLGYVNALVAVVAGRKYDDARLRLVLFAAALCAFALNWGSDTGISVSAYSIPLLLSGLFARFLNLPPQWHARTTAALRSFALPAIVWALLPICVWSTARQCYRDAAIPDTHVRHASIGPVYTTPARSRGLRHLVRAIERYAKPGDAVLIADSMPLLHFMTATRPYLQNSWPALYTRAELRQRFAAAEEVSLPVLVVAAKLNARSGEWPETDREPVRMGPIYDFIRRHRFEVVWENGDAALYQRSEP
jgi:hypothetical protein